MALTETEECFCIGCCDRSHLFGGDRMNLCETLIGGGNPCGFVSLASPGLWREVGSIRFDEESIEGDSGCDFANGIILFIGEHATEG